MKQLARYSHLILFAAVLVMVWLYGRSQRSQGELKERVKARETVIAAIAKQHKTDTLVFTRWKTKYDSLTDTLQITDTVWVKQFIATADSTITTCSNALASCEALQREKDALIRDLKKRRGSRFGCAGPLTVTSKGFDLGASCGLKF